MKIFFKITAVIIVFLAIVVFCLMNYNDQRSLFVSDSASEYQTKVIDEYDSENIRRYKRSDFDVEKKDLLLSSLIDSLEVIKLDNDDDALIGNNLKAIISDSYILVYSINERECKLFDRKTGTFLRHIGSEGQGPGEYAYVYDQVIDEKNNRVYLGDVNNKSILEYELNGKFIQRIKLFKEIKKFRFIVTGDTITSFIMPFIGDSIAVQISDKQGNVLATAPARVLTTPDFSWEIFIENNGVTPIGYSHVLSPVYYTYDEKRYQLVPIFSFDKESLGYVSVVDLPNRYLFGFNKIQGEGMNAHYRSYEYAQVLKSNEEITKVDPLNDFLGGISFSPANFSNGYYLQVMKAYYFREQLKKVLDEKKLDVRLSNYLQELYDSMSDEDNDVVLCGKLKV